jgi:hypothetical protein
MQDLIPYSPASNEESEKLQEELKGASSWSCLKAADTKTK